MERKTLWVVFVLNFALFVIECTTGVISNSLGLVTDSLDMFADAMIYGMSLYALGHVAVRKKRIAFTQCGIQTAVLLVVGFEIVRRFILDTPLPDYRFMVIVASVAFVANFISFILLKKLHSKDPNIKVSYICSRIDCITNLGVIVGGVLVLVTESKLPDLIISTLIFVWALKELVEMYITAGKGEAGCSCSRGGKTKPEMLEKDCTKPQHGL